MKKKISWDLKKRCRMGNSNFNMSKEKYWFFPLNVLLHLSHFSKWFCPLWSHSRWKLQSSLILALPSPLTFNLTIIFIHNIFNIDRKSIFFFSHTSIQSQATLIFSLKNAITFSLFIVLPWPSHSPFSRSKKWGRLKTFVKQYHSHA